MVNVCSRFPDALILSYEEKYLFIDSLFRRRSNFLLIPHVSHYGDLENLNGFRPMGSDGFYSGDTTGKLIIGLDPSVRHFRDFNGIMRHG